ncbi:MAG TPA: flagellar basal-body rod protein FlgG [Methylomirabilota bacterium]|nr:flagellar basal-body rod protein FlgG [Methylomirabilota bacterium]
MRALSIGATGMMAQQLNVEVISNNIANMSTTGYKRQRAEFQDLLYQQERHVGSPTSDTGTILPSGVQVGLGVKTAAISRDDEQGALAKTDNRLDVALQGPGFFNVQLPNGDTAYTRAGSFQLAADGTIVTADGYPVQPAIVIPANAKDVVISTAGEVFAYFDGQVQPQNLGQLELSTFINDNGLEAEGNNLFKETTASGAPTVGVAGQTGFGTILQGYLEGSNVNVVSEITNLIQAQRAYEMNSKSIETADQMLQTITQLR